MRERASLLRSSMKGNILGQGEHVNYQALYVMILTFGAIGQSHGMQMHLQREIAALQSEMGRELLWYKMRPAVPAVASRTRYEFLSPSMKDRLLEAGVATGVACIVMGVVVVLMGQKDQKFTTEFVRKVEKPTTTFADVAGMVKAKEECQLFIDFIKNPKKYTDLGIRPPRGLLLEGPPGNGKTLLARAVAGEAGCSFFEAKGSEFCEMYVGVGAARIRALFAQARKHAPSIIFIDEIDSVGGKRSRIADHREATTMLNQLLAEMDGFGSQDSLVFVMGATNQKDQLDEALKRSGRFDAHINIVLPEKAERLAILAVHAKNKKLAADVSLAALAEDTGGFCGADLENILNKAALRAVQRNQACITMQDCDDAIEAMRDAMTKEEFNRHLLAANQK